MEMKFTPEEVMEICRVCGDPIPSCAGCPGFRERSCTVDSVTRRSYDALKALTEENKRLREELRWISVEERLPEAGEQVLAVCEEGVREARYLGVNGWWRLAIGISTRGVSRWMPMPTEEAGVHWEPRTRLEQIRCMSLEELAERLLTLHDGDAGSYCRMKAECVAALEENHPETITEGHCLECIKEWLMEEV